MKMALARYGRQDLDRWSNKPVAELVYWYELLAELISGENEVSRMAEE